jgi:hypothetical protein
MSDIDWKQAFEFERDKFQRETIRSFRLSQQLAECQAREKVLRDALQQCAYDEEGVCISPDAAEALDMPSDSTALDQAIKQAKREILLDAATTMRVELRFNFAEWLTRIAEELK